MRTGKNQKRLLTLAISLALAGSVGYASPHNTVEVENVSQGQMSVGFVSGADTDRLIDSEYIYDSGSGTSVTITAIDFQNVANYSLSVANGDITVSRGAGSDSGDMAFTGVRWQGGLGNALWRSAAAFIVSTHPPATTAITAIRPRCITQRCTITAARSRSMAR